MRASGRVSRFAATTASAMAGQAVALPIRSARDPDERERRPSRQHAVAGFSLLECLIALLLIGFAMLMATALLNTMSTTAARLRTQHELLRSLEAAAANVRAGAVPLRSGPMTIDPEMSSAPLTDHRIALEVEAGDIPGLYQVTVHVRCSFSLEQPLHRSLTTMVWRP